MFFHRVESQEQETLFSTSSQENSGTHLCLPLTPTVPVTPISSVSRGELLHVSYQLLYHIMILLKGCSEKAFELVIDLTQVTSANEPDVRDTLTPHRVVSVLG